MVGAVLAIGIAIAAVQHDPSAAMADLDSADPATRTRAACALRDLGSGAAPAIPRLAAMLADGSPVDPAVCGERTWRTVRGEDRVTSPGEQAAAALVSIGTPSFPAVSATLKSPAWIARKNAAWALGVFERSEAVGGLIDALNDSEAAVRAEAVWALGVIRDSRATDPVMKALSDSAAEVREQAAWALGILRDSRAVPGLTRALKDGSARVRRQAAWALGVIGS